MIIWESFYHGYSGITNSAMKMVECLEKAGIEHRIHALKKIEESHPLYDKQATRKELGEEKVILHQLPTVNPYAHGYYSVFEFDIPPHEWWNLLRNSEILMTQSTFCKDVFQSVPGMEDKDIPIIPFPIDERFSSNGPDLKKNIKNRITGKYLSDYEFVFGSAFQWVARKKPEFMWTAFIEEFPYKEYPDIAFVCKVDIPGGVPRGFRNWKSFIPKDPRIIIVEDYIPDMADFYRSLDSYVSPTAGEGFGITIMEAMASGLPTIASKHSGNLDFTNNNNSYLVETTDWVQVGDDPQNFLPMVHDYHRWKLPKVDSIRAAMRDIYKGNGVIDKCYEAEKVKEIYSVDNVAKKLAEVFEK